MIDGEVYKNMICQAAGIVEDRMEEINALNVFPVPDGDTGTNMSMTLNNAVKELSKLENPTLGRALDVTCSALLRGARGNSGVITSLLFRGIAKGLKDLRTADGAALANALAEGSATAYKAVMKPAEGTILTVSRIAGTAAQKAAQLSRDPETVLSAAIKAARKALDETVNQNPVLKKAGVVDAGAFGYVLILQGMQDAVSGAITRLARKIPVPVVNPAMTVEGADFSQFDEGEINYDYCTEFIAARETPGKDPDEMRQFLATIGDCVVVVEDDEIIKIHVHTNTPDRALAKGLEFGQLITVKVENMVQQHRKKVEEETAAGMGKRESAAPVTRYGFVAVAAGEGVCALFKELGAEQIVEGGQTMNPSTADILAAAKQARAEQVIVLPNNGNIIMAAQSAAAAADFPMAVVTTRSVPQGFSAMFAFNPTASLEDNAAAMAEVLPGVHDGEITHAVRDSQTVNGDAIHSGDVIGLVDDKVTYVGSDVCDMCVEMVKAMQADIEGDTLTILAGLDMPQDEFEALVERLEDAVPDLDVDAHRGEQPLYPIVLSIE